MHAHRLIAVIAAALLGIAAQAAAEMPTAPRFDVPRGQRLSPAAVPGADGAALQVAALDSRLITPRMHANRQPKAAPDATHLPEPPLGALVFATVGALVLLRGRRIERP